MFFYMGFDLNMAINVTISFCESTQINTSTIQYEAVHILLLQIFHNKISFLNKRIDSVNRNALVLLF